MKPNNSPINVYLPISEKESVCGSNGNALAARSQPRRLRTLLQRCRCVALMLLTFVLAAAGPAARTQATYLKMHSFGGTPTDGAYPEAALIQGRDGYFYGTTVDGGAGGTNSGFGTFFRADSSGNVSVKHAFSGADGAFPMGPVIQASDGYFYGTTSNGGWMNNGLDMGTVFKMDSSGTLIWVYSFGTAANDGAFPMAGLVEASDGYLYGTTTSGGSITVGGTVVNLNMGTVFKIDTSGHESMVYAFGTNANDGNTPMAALIEARGYLYGTTAYGGLSGNGAIFRIAASGHESVVYSFGSVQNDGVNPMAALLQDGDGNLYGTTDEGGSENAGTVFKLSTSNGSYAILHSFDPFSGDGQYPAAPLIQAKDGYLYGTTSSGGAYSNEGAGSGGTVFRIDTVGAKQAHSGTIAYPYWVLHSFGATATDGQNPVAALVQAADGNLYGTTENGGAYTDPNMSGVYVGTIFSVATTITIENISIVANKSAGKPVSYTATITLRNTGYFNAANVMLVRGSLGSKATSSAMPMPVGNIGAGAQKTIVCKFPATAGGLGMVVSLSVTGTFTGGTFGGSFAVRL